MNRHSLTTRQAEILMAMLILARSTSYVMTKIALRELSVFNLLGVRFLSAFVLMVPLVWHELLNVSVRTIMRGLILGGVAALVMSAEVTGLRTADASTAAFLENSAVIFVPLTEAAIQFRLPRRRETLSALIAITGIGLLTLKGGTFRVSEGELFCLTAAILYTFAIIITERLSHRDNPLVLGVLQVMFMGLFTLAISFVSESTRLPSEMPTLYAVIALSVVCTCFGFTLQPLAQSKLTSERASLFCAIGPVGGALCGWAFLGESVSAWGLLGMGLILGAVILSTVKR